MSPNEDDSSHCVSRLRIREQEKGRRKTPGKCQTTRLVLLCPTRPVTSCRVEKQRATVGRDSDVTRSPPHGNLLIDGEDRVVTSVVNLFIVGIPQGRPCLIRVI